MTERELHILIDVLYRKHKTDIDKLLVKDTISEKTDRSTEFGSDFGFVSRQTLTTIEIMDSDVFRIINDVYTYNPSIGDSIVNQVQSNKDQLTSHVMDLTELRRRIVDLEMENQNLKFKLEGLLNEKGE